MESEKLIKNISNSSEIKWSKYDVFDYPVVIKDIIKNNKTLIMKYQNSIHCTTYTFELNTIYVGEYKTTFIVLLKYIDCNKFDELRIYSVNSTIDLSKLIIGQEYLMFLQDKIKKQIDNRILEGNLKDFIY